MSFLCTTWVTFLSKMVDNSGSMYSLRVKLKRHIEEEVSVAKKRKDRAKENYNEFRLRLKANNTLYEDYKRKDALKKKEYRKSLTPEQRKISNEKTKIRMQVYRERQRERGFIKPKPSTRIQINKQREYWRLKKREQRAKMTQQAKRRENEKRRERYQAAKKKLFANQDEESKNSKTSNARYLPKNPERFAARINAAIQHATPKKRDALRRRGLLIPVNSKMKMETNEKIVARVKRALIELKRQQSKEGRSRYQLLTRTIVGKYTVEHSIRKALGVKWDYWLKMSAIERNGTEHLKRFNSLPDEMVQNIQTFYQHESVTLPTKKTVSIKTSKQKSVLTESLQEVHRRFLIENPDLKVSLSQFRKLRPKEVLTVNQQKFNSCLCEYCLNTQFKMDVINQSLKSHGIKSMFESKFQAVNISLCEKGKSVFHKKECIERNCKYCGTNKLKKFLSPLIAADQDSQMYTWKKWQLGNIKTAGGKETKRQILVEHSGTLSELIDEFVSAVEYLANHLFIARWQYKQFSELTKSVPDNMVVTVADFSENYRCVHQDEIQAAYYNYSQATLFPIIGYYRCPDCKDSIVQESAVFITPDLTHDAIAVEQFSEKMFAHIQSHASVGKEVQFSDGAASQFKSKLPFLHVSESKTHSMERAFFGSRHGKSPCDALGGLVKKKAETHVKSRKGTIQSAKALFDYCKENLTIHEGSKCEHKKRVFFYQETINREELKEDLQTLKGTQKLHSVRGIKPGIVKSRQLSCFCKVCLEDEEGICHNSQYTGDWKMHSVVKGKKTEIVVKDKKQKEQRKKENKKQNALAKSTKPLPMCSSINEIRARLSEMKMEKLPPFSQKSFYVTGKKVDKTNIELVPTDIPIAPTEELYPSTIYGDGNCLPRSASLLVYGSEDHYQEMRERIVEELLKNKDMYLDNKYMKKGMNDMGNKDVTKAFAMYSGMYTGTQRLNKQSIKKLFEKELVSIVKDGVYMGLWQLASIANILSCPVVSVCPTYGMHTVRNDMHRVFYPFKEDDCNKEPVFIMWTNINGKVVPEKEFVVNHYVVLMPLFEKVEVSNDLDLSFDIDPCEDTELEDGILEVLDNLEFTGTGEQLDKVSNEVTDEESITQSEQVALTKTNKGLNEQTDMETGYQPIININIGKSENIGTETIQKPVAKSDKGQKEQPKTETSEQPIINIDTGLNVNIETETSQKPVVKSDKGQKEQSETEASEQPIINISIGQSENIETETIQKPVVKSDKGQKKQPETETSEHPIINIDIGLNVNIETETIQKPVVKSDKGQKEQPETETSEQPVVMSVDKLNEKPIRNTSEMSERETETSEQPIIKVDTGINVNFETETIQKPVLKSDTGLKEHPETETSEQPIINIDTGLNGNIETETIQKPVVKSDKGQKDQPKTETSEQPIINIAIGLNGNIETETIQKPVVKSDKGQKDQPKTETSEQPIINIDIGLNGNIETETIQKPVVKSDTGLKEQPETETSEKPIINVDTGINVNIETETIQKPVLKSDTILKEQPKTGKSEQPIINIDTGLNGNIETETIQKPVVKSDKGQKEQPKTETSEQPIINIDIGLNGNIETETIQKPGLKSDTGLKEQPETETSEQPIINIDTGLNVNIETETSQKPVVKSDKGQKEQSETEASEQPIINISIGQSENIETETIQKPVVKSDKGQKEQPETETSEHPIINTDIGLNVNIETETIQKPVVKSDKGQKEQPETETSEQPVVMSDEKPIQNTSEMSELDASTQLPVGTDEQLEHGTTVPSLMRGQSCVETTGQQSLGTIKQSIVEATDPQRTREQSTSDLSELSHKQWTYINVSHGHEIIPAVVHEWPYIRYFKKDRKIPGLWHDLDILHTVDSEDVIGKRDPPEIVKRGRRIYYRF